MDYEKLFWGFTAAVFIGFFVFLAMDIAAKPADAAPAGETGADVYYAPYGGAKDFVGGCGAGCGRAGGLQGGNAPSLPAEGVGCGCGGGAGGCSGAGAQTADGYGAAAAPKPAAGGGCGCGGNI